jgi:hypothetical protein
MITILGADALAPFRKHTEEDCRTSQQYCSVHWSLHHFLQRKRIVPRTRSHSRKTKIPFKTIGMLDSLAAVLLDAAHHLLVLAAIAKAELGDWLEPIAAPELERERERRMSAGQWSKGVRPRLMAVPQPGETLQAAQQRAIYAYLAEHPDAPKTISAFDWCPAIS